MKRKLFILSSLIFTLASGCYYDIADELYPQNAGPCEASPATFTTVNNLLSTYGCLSCHGGGAPSGGVSLANYTSVKAVANSGKLMGAITHSPGFSPMPQGGNKMSQCDINKIKAWIDAGALQN